MVINALNSGATRLHGRLRGRQLADLAQHDRRAANLADAVRGTLSRRRGRASTTRSTTSRATLLVRPRGWHLPEAPPEIDGRPIAGALFDFGLFAFHNAQELLDRGAGPFFYLPKLESHQEARLWNDVFTLAETKLDLARLGPRHRPDRDEPAAFEMDEILYELRDHSAGLNAGRWDYLFSLIKVHREDPRFVLPDRAKVTMTVPFMRAYTELLVKTCHRRHAHAIGGMSAVIPTRTDEEAKKRRSRPSPPTSAARPRPATTAPGSPTPTRSRRPPGEFDHVLGERPNQVDRQRDDVDVTARDLLAVAARAQHREGPAQQRQRRASSTSRPLAARQRRGRHLRTDGGRRDRRDRPRRRCGSGSATAPAQDTGEPVTPELVRQLADEELETIRAEIGDDEWFEREGRPQESRAVRAGRAERRRLRRVPHAPRVRGARKIENAASGLAHAVADVGDGRRGHDLDRLQLPGRRRPPAAARPRPGSPGRCAGTGRRSARRAGTAGRCWRRRRCPRACRRRPPGPAPARPRSRRSRSGTWCRPPSAAALARGG